MSDDRVFERYRLFVFDADDTLRRTTVPGKPCPHRPGEWALLPGVQEKLGQIGWNQPGQPKIGLASNQDQIGYGHLSLEAARELLRDLAQSAAGLVPPDPALQLCPHPLEVSCSCRKPEPGMLLEIMSHYGIGPRDTLFVGNHTIDMEAARRAGTAFQWAADFFPAGALASSPAARASAGGQH
jgi:D-glycero-D-manno-heptose 1,7-bisphosphate phosphatase